MYGGGWSRTAKQLYTDSNFFVHFSSWGPTMTLVETVSFFFKTVKLSDMNLTVSEAFRL